MFKADLKMRFIWALLLFFIFGRTKGQQRRETETYDYIVIGCGISGLVVSTRLSELYNVDILCLEAGPFDHAEDTITIPNFIGRQPAGFYDWQMTTTPQSQLDGAIRPIPVGRGVGGGSLINGMLWNRGNQETYDAWEELGNPGWSWADLHPYFRKTETFTPRTYINQTMPATALGTGFHGTSGPVQVTYPQYLWSQSNNWFKALESVGIPTVADPNQGLSAGGYFLPVNLDAKTQTRHDARRAYYDPISNRTNLRVQPNSHVRKIVFDTTETVRAAAVEYQNVNTADQVRIAFARKEIIIAAGALHTPQILELSGIGQASILQGLKIPVVLDIPGVGNNLQDHALIHLRYDYTAPQLITSTTFDTDPVFNEQCKEQYDSAREGPWTAAPLEAVAFPSLMQFASNITKLLQTIDLNTSSFLPIMYENEVRAGFEAQAWALHASLCNDSVPAIEVLHDSAGRLDLALQRPFSRGFVHIYSTDPLLPPVVNPNWLSHPIDFEIMVDAMKLNQRLIDTQALQELRPSDISVPRNATRQQMTDTLRSGIGTEFHVSGTAAMLPLHLGGVVDPALKVYGTENLRIVDTSVYPLIPAAHLQAVTFAVAEKAADIIKGVLPGPAMV